ncbi:Putative ABC transporter substrate-binding protein [Kitasatospora sp. MMS16-BH015]|uniref:extracellular solute-binding protein n=1 Tax=Kitasatospora sp. MMS16-BH015 TaxID=2018025 RepID=UPI000CA3731A|nr:extracellular solute-binding protein [Kitasatospora sp. MMS16-BH015]AUG79120.1 Putative ABC transporter substrate-binding protein [Kitasatospora sp. MMS16-BH015]
MSNPPAQKSRWSALVAACVLLTGGCGSLLPLGGGGDVTLKFVAADYGDSEATSSTPYWNDLARAFEAANPLIKVDVQVVPWTEIDKRVADLIKKGDTPDVVQTGGYADQVAAGRLYPASDVLTIDTQADLIDAFAKAGQVLGSQYGIPFVASSRAFVYNKAIFTKAGIDQPPATWEDLRKDAEQIKRKVPGVIPYGLPLGPEEAQAEASMWTMSGGGGLADTGGNYTVDSPQNRATFDWLRTQLVQPGLTYPDPAAVDRKAAFADFVAGKVAMLDGHPSLIQKAVAAKVDYGTSPIPHKDPQAKPITLGVADWMMAFKANGHRVEIKKFLSWVYREDNTLKFDEQYNLLPVTQSTLAAMTAGGHEDLKPFLAVLPNASFYPLGDPAWDTVNGLVKQRIGGAVKQGGDQVLGDLQAAAAQAAAHSRG